MLLLGIASALADDSLERYPWAAHVAGTGDELTLYDAAGHPVSTHGALEYIGEPALAQALRRQRTTRAVGATAMWVVGGALILGSYEVSDLRSDTPRLVVAGTGIFLFGGAFVVEFNPNGRSLGDWVDRARVETAIRAHAGTQGPEGDHAFLELTVDDAGVVRRGTGERVPMEELVVILDDEATGEAWRAAHARYQSLFQPAIWGGVALVHGGLLVTGISSMINSESRTGGSPVGPVVGVATALAGGGLLTGGLVGWVHARHTVDDPATWFGADRLYGGIKDHNRGLGRAPSPVHVELALGPGSVGINGTF